MTLYLLDISGWNPGVDLAGWKAVFAKVTEADHFLSSQYAAQRAEAGRHGTYFGAYHFLHQGGAPAQARYAFNAVKAQDGNGKTPLMLDVELTTASLPRSARGDQEMAPHIDRLTRVSEAPRDLNSVPQLADATAFIDAYRGLGGVCHFVYLPRWYHSGHMGSPSLQPLASRQMLLWSSAYTGFTNADSGTGWQPYGNMYPSVWQYTDQLPTSGQKLDCSAYRGTHPGDESPAALADTLAQFRSLATTGLMPGTQYAQNPPPGLILDHADKTGFMVRWGACARATGYHIRCYQLNGVVTNEFDVPASQQYANCYGLHPGWSYDVWVWAKPGQPGGQHATLRVTLPG